MAKSTMETIIDRGGKMRFNIYPFEGPYTTHQGVNVRLPRKKEQNGLGDTYDTISITRKSLYRNHGALSHDNIDKWIQENHCARKKGDDIYVFACSAEESNGVITYKLTKLLGKRKPHSNKITPVKLKRDNCGSE